MRAGIFAIVMAVSIGGATATPARAQSSERIATSFGYFMGCWRGFFENGDPSIYEERCVSSTLNGQYVRDIHITRGTTYWGESLIGYDANAASFMYVYFDANGGRSEGAVRLDNGALIFPNDTHVTSDGDTLILRTTWRPVDPDTFYAETDRQGPGETWTPFMRATYSRARELTSVAPAAD